MAMHSVGMGLAGPGGGAGAVELVGVLRRAHEQEVRQRRVSVAGRAAACTEHAAKTWHPPVPTVGTRRWSKSSAATNSMKLDGRSKRVRARVGQGCGLGKPASCGHASSPRNRLES